MSYAGFFTWRYANRAFADAVKFGALVPGQCCVMRVDAFNGGGITEGWQLTIKPNMLRRKPPDLNGLLDLRKG